MHVDAYGQGGQCQLRLGSPLRGVLVVGVFCLIAIQSTAVAATYYVDPVSGNDDRDGRSRQTAWKTVPHAEQSAVNGSTVYLVGGNYGSLRIDRADNSGRKSWSEGIVFTAYPGEVPTFTNITLWEHVHRYPTFDKLLVDCPYINGQVAVSIHDGEYIRLQNSEIRGVLGKDDQGRYSTANSTGLLLELGHFTTSTGIGNLFITGCDIHTNGGSAVITKGPLTADIWLQSNRVHNFGGTGISANGATNGYRTYLQNNHVYIQESIWLGTEWQHGSGLGIRIADLTATGNILRACGASTSITCYSDAVPAHGYHDMVFENNLIYDPLNTAYCVRLEKIGSNFKFNNNSVVGSHAQGAGTYYYQSTLYITGFHAECDKTSVQVCNNLLVGYAGGLHGTGVKCIGNIFHSYAVGTGVWQDQTWLNTNLPGNRVYCWSQTKENGEFRTPGRIFKGGPLFDQYAFTRPGGLSHKVDLGDSFALAPGSDAIGYASAAYLPATDIKGAPRDGSHDSGCYRYRPVGTGPVFDPVGSKEATAGTLLKFDVTASDPNGDPLTYSASGLPQGATFSGQTFAWTPAANQLGTHQVTFTVSDGRTQDSATITITVAKPNSPPVLGAIGGKSVNENALLTFAVNATDADVQDTLTYSATGLPNGATYSGQTFTWKPGYNQAGSYQMTFVVSDGRDQDSETVTINVANVNRTPAMNSISDRSVDAGDTLQFSLAATDPDGDSLTYSASDMPAGASLSGRNFTWTPATDQIGSFDITFTASDGGLHDSKTATIMVVAPQPDTTAPVVARCSPEPDSIQVPLNNLVTLHVTDAGRGVESASVAIRVNDQIVYQGDETLYTSPYGRCSRSGSKNDYRYVYQPDRMSEYDQTMTVKVNAADRQGNVMDEYTYSYVTEMQSFGANRQVSVRMSSADANRPVTVCDNAGNLWAAWHMGAPGSRDIYVARLIPGADSFQTPVRLTSDAADQCNPDLAAGSDGKVYLVWQDNRRGNWDIFAAVCSNHRNFSKEIQVSDSDENEMNPAVAVDGQSPNCVYVAWQDDRDSHQDIYVGSSANAFVSTVITRVTNSGADQTDADLTVGAEDIVYVVWTDMRSGQPDIYAAASSTGPWTNVPVVTTASEQANPAVTAESGGTTLHLLWVDNARGNRDIYYASLAGLPETPITGRSLVDDTSGADQGSPSIACAQPGRAFACWHDARHADTDGADTDLYFVEIRGGVAKTNILVGDDNTNTAQSEPAIGVNAYGHPYVVWSDDRTQAAQVYYAAGTFIDPDPLDSKLVAAAAGATIGTDPTTIDQVEDVSIVVPPGACQIDLRVTISRVVNPQAQAIECLGSYDFGPSGVDFDQPVTVTVAYRYAVSGGHHALPYWYDALTGVLSQQGITDVENIVISSDLNALRFRTTHFTAFYLVASDSESGTTADADSIGAGACSISKMGGGSPKELLVPYGAIATIMIILRRRDRRRRKSLESIKTSE